MSWLLLASNVSLSPFTGCAGIALAGRRRHAALAACLALATPVQAVDGVLEINQTCAVQTGCFAGDTAGFPVTIGQAGSYRLTGNLEVPSTTADGIEVLAEGVTLDLNGFRLEGPGSGSGNGVEGEGDLVVRNGFVRSFGARGIVLTGGIVEDMVVSLNGGDGISSTEGKTLVRGCVVTDNGGVGLDLGARAGYGENLVADNAQRAVIGGQAVASNACDEATCSSPRRRLYYLTQSFHNGSGAATACDPGFHMASLWEIRDTSSLDYDVLRGRTRADSGDGPPRFSGWIRTGTSSDGTPEPGFGNCMAYTSNLAGDYGSLAVAGSENSWSSSDWSTGAANELSHTWGWTASGFECSGFSSVWCVQD